VTSHKRARRARKAKVHFCSFTYKGRKFRLSLEMEARVIVLDSGERRNVATSNPRGLKALVETLRHTHERHARDNRARYEPPPKEAEAYKEGIQRMHENVLVLKDKYRSMGLYIPVTLEEMIDDYCEWTTGRVDKEREGCLYESEVVLEVSPESSERFVIEKDSEREAALETAKQFMLNPSKFQSVRAQPEVETIVELPESAASTGVVPIAELLANAAARATSILTGGGDPGDPPPPSVPSGQAGGRPEVIVSSDTIDIPDDEEEAEVSYLQAPAALGAKPKRSKSIKGGRLGMLFYTAKKTVGELTRTLSEGSESTPNPPNTSTGIRPSAPPPRAVPPKETAGLPEETRFEDALDGRVTPVLSGMSKEEMIALIDERITRALTQMGKETAEAIAESTLRASQRETIRTQALVENMGQRLRDEMKELNRKFAEDLREVMRAELTATALETCRRPPPGDGGAPVKEEREASPRRDLRPRERQGGADTRYGGRHTQSLADVRFDGPGRDRPSNRDQLYDPPPRRDPLNREAPGSTLHLWREEWAGEPNPTTSVWAHRGTVRDGSNRSSNDSGRHYCGGNKLKTFSGGKEDYVSWRQSLFRCLERLQYRDPKDEAQFLYDHLGGQAQGYVTQLYYPLTDSSYKIMLSHLDRLYGEEQTADRTRIDRLYSLPKLSDFTKENLATMIAIVEAAVDPLSRVDPTSLTSSQSRELRKLKSLLPTIQQEFFLEYCDNHYRPVNIRSLLAFLYRKFDARRAESGGLSKTGKSSRKESGEKTRERRKGKRLDDQPKTFLALNETTTSGSESEVGPVLATQERKCPQCEGNHTLGYCPKFKNMTYAERTEAVRTHKVCMCCLKVGHVIRNCRSLKRCSVEGCKRKHHYLLHNNDVAKVLYYEQGGEEFSSSESSSSERH